MPFHHTLHAIPRFSLKPTFFGYSTFRNANRSLHVTRPRLRPSTPNQPPETPLPDAFRHKAIEHSSPIKTFNGEFARGPSVRKQVFFAVGGSFLCMTLAAAATSADTEVWTENLKKYSSGIPFAGEPTSTDLKRAKLFVLGKNLQTGLVSLKDMVNSYPVPAYFKYYIIRAYVDIAQPYVDAYEGRRLCWKISMINCAIYIAWKIRRLQPTMNANWTHHPLRGKAFTLLTSVFSHNTLFHLFFNCMALNAFGSSATRYFAKAQAEGDSQLQESTATYHFLGFFVSAGLFSGLLSHVVSARFRYPRMVAQFASSSSKTVPPIRAASAPSFASLASSSTTSTGAAAAAATSTGATVAQQVPGILPSLGASGAIYAALVVTALGFPDAQLALAIPPSFPMPIQTGVGGLVLLDTIGVLRGWRVFDHWAHLGGAAFGGVYFYYGPKFWDWLRESMEDEAESSASKVLRAV